MSDANHRPTALIAEDEPLLLTALGALLARVWPELEIIAVAHDGIAATDQSLARAPDVLFLDIKMPGRSGLEVAEVVTDEWPDEKPEPLYVFVTAYDEFAVTAFERAAVDYLLKPVTVDRLQMTVARLRERLASRVPARPGEMASLVKNLQSLSQHPDEPAERIRVIRAGLGSTVRMIPVREVAYLEAADKYVNVGTAAGEALVRMSLRELLSRIDGVELMQVHRSVVVNPAFIASATRDDLGHYTLNLRGLKKTLNVSRAFAHLFRPM